MGLSSFEIVLEVEEAFAVSLPSEESQNIRTVGELHALVLKLVLHREVDSNRCLSAATFYELRRAIWSSEKLTTVPLHNILLCNLSDLTQTSPYQSILLKVLISSNFS